MTNSRRDKKLESELTELLSPSFPGIHVSVDHSDRWDRMCVMFTWEGFTDLLPEERFHRLVTHIPEKVRETKLAGFVWLELAKGESIDEFLHLPRSEDVADREEGIYNTLLKAKFFDTLKQSLKPSPAKACKGDFVHVAKVLAERKYTPAKIRDAKLVFIRHGAYCDCQVVDTIQAELAKKHAKSK